MPEIQAFRGIRYDLGHVGSLSDVVAPPYDVIGPDLQDAALPEKSLQRGAADSQPHRAGRRQRGEQSLYPGEAVPQELAVRGGPVHGGRPGHLRLSPGVRLRGHDLHPPRLHGPAAAVAVWRGPGLPARRDPLRPEGRPPDAHHCLQGEPEPGVWAVSRPGRRCPADLSTRPSPP